MKLILSLFLLLASMSSFAQDRVCLVSNGMYNTNISAEIFDARLGTTFYSYKFNIPYGSQWCSERFYPELGDTVKVNTSHFIFTNMTRDTCPEFRTNESVYVVVGGTTLDYYCTVKKCQNKGCTEI